MSEESYTGRYLDLSDNIFTIAKSEPIIAYCDPTIPFGSIVPLNERNFNQEKDIEKQNNREIIIYLRQCELKDREKLTLDAPKESESMIDPNIQKCISTLGNSNSPGSCDLSITLRKPTRSCVLHPISKFISSKIYWVLCFYL